MKNSLGNSDVNYTFFDRIVKYKAWNPPHPPPPRGVGQFIQVELKFSPTSWGWGYSQIGRLKLLVS